MYPAVVAEVEYRPCRPGPVWEAFLSSLPSKLALAEGKSSVTSDVYLERAALLSRQDQKEVPHQKILDLEENGRWPPCRDLARLLRVDFSFFERDLPRQVEYPWEWTTALVRLQLKHNNIAHETSDRFFIDERLVAVERQAANIYRPYLWDTTTTQHVAPPVVKKTTPMRKKKKKSEDDDKKKRADYAFEFEALTKSRVGLAEVGVGAVVSFILNEERHRATVVRRDAKGAFFDLRLNDNSSSSSRARFVSKVPRAKLDLEFPTDDTFRCEPPRSSRELNLYRLWNESWSRHDDDFTEEKKLRMLRDRLTEAQVTPWRGPAERTHDEKRAWQRKLGRARQTVLDRRRQKDAQQYATKNTFGAPAAQKRQPKDMTPAEREEALVCSALVFAALRVDKLVTTLREDLEVVEAETKKKDWRQLCGAFIRQDLAGSFQAAVLVLVEALDNWASLVAEEPPRTFIWKGQDLRLHLRSSLNFLQGSVVARFLGPDFPITDNPLMLPEVPLDAKTADALVATAPKPPHPHWPPIGATADDRRRAYRAAKTLFYATIQVAA